MERSFRSASIGGVEGSLDRDFKHKKHFHLQYNTPPSTSTRYSTLHSTFDLYSYLSAAWVLDLDKDETSREESKKKKRKIESVSTGDDRKKKGERGLTAWDTGASCSSSNLPCMDRPREELSCAVKLNGRCCTVNTALWNTVQILFPQEVEARRAAEAPKTRGNHYNLRNQSIQTVNSPGAEFSRAAKRLTATVDKVTTTVDKCFTRSSRWSFDRSIGDYKFTSFVPKVLKA
ncbi:hypothetical protein TEA_018579 [Camellia sinensis var. sinensis]|uniref:Uncharacterized protein n=1 Tax=Camellia sinensis var. sinensis TaxID=542762 RepID=A0A4S4ET42_CAMSN|nr:hypothetical protein TEA_018579 [Camellia sinensis var. sinensis]